MYMYMFMYMYKSTGKYLNNYKRKCFYLQNYVAEYRNRTKDVWKRMNELLERVFQLLANKLFCCHFTQTLFRKLNY